jgi:surfeit locus 1 family protein
MGDVPDEQQHDAHGGDGRLKAARGRRRTALAALCAAFALLFIALGVWQVERRVWKLDLIATVDARAHAAPAWATFAATPAYSRLRIEGVFDHTRETRVEAVTGRGEGAWLMTPLRTTAGWTVLINRGFVPAGPAAVNRPKGAITVTGFARETEPVGGFLRANDPARDRWYARDVAAIAARRGLGSVAPYFIDADASGTGYPLGGLTVIRFRNQHLSYALTWFGLAVLSLFGLWRVLRER